MHYEIDWKRVFVEAGIRLLTIFNAQLIWPVLPLSGLQVIGETFSGHQNFPIPTLTRTAPAFGHRAAPELYSQSPVGPLTSRGMTNFFRNSSLLHASNTSGVLGMIFGWKLSSDLSVYDLLVQKFLKRVTGFN